MASFQQERLCQPSRWQQQQGSQRRRPAGLTAVLVALALAAQLPATEGVKAISSWSSGLIT